MKYENHLDGLRAISILLVILNHLHGVPTYIRGNVGVDIFFAISGFLITTILCIELDRAGTISLSKFYTRRAFRILPLYFLTIAMYAVLSYGIAMTGDNRKLAAFLQSAPYLLTLNAEFNIGDDNAIFGQAWSLGIEEKFYLFWPLILLLVAKSGRTSIVALIASAGIVLASLIGEPHMLRGYVGLIFASAMAIAIRKSDILRKFLGARALAHWFVLGALGCYAFVPLIDVVLSNVLIGAMVTGAIISLHCRPDQIVGKFLAVPVLAGIGKLSYGIYLNHVIVINFVYLLSSRLSLKLNAWPLAYFVTVVCSVLVAYALHRVVERPLIEIGRLFTQTRKLEDHFEAGESEPAARVRS